MIPPADLVYLCSLFGACSKRTQGAGGNISVKQEGLLWIKSSGTRLSSVSKKKGFASCKLNVLQELFERGNECLTSALAYPESESPSMETFFHLLPYSHIVHIHPTFFCKYLCSKEARTIFRVENFPNSLYIPYIKPGYPLAKAIFDYHTYETLIFLENHGIILLGNSVDEVIQLFTEATHQLEKIVGEKNTASPIAVEHQLYQLTNEFAKPVYPELAIPSVFDPITPDHFLFLKEAPLFTTKDTLEKDLLDCKSMPSVVHIDKHSYTLGKTVEQAQDKEDYLRSYVEIWSDSTYLNQENTADLLNCSKEKLRMNKE
jgi:rhamnose utilization protein RhaD (predicted bifunctional aldolase and dehydrogenase)